MKIYLDVCAVQRPLDTPNHLRIALEAEAILGVLALCESGRIELVSSDALVYETEQNPLPVRKEYALIVLRKAREMTVEVRPLVEINQQALRVLYQELGIVDTVRFLRQFTTGFGDYTKEREALFAEKSLANIVQEIKHRESSNTQ